VLVVTLPLGLLFFILGGSAGEGEAVGCGLFLLLIALIGFLSVVPGAVNGDVCW
jgi:hypothetical protein